MSKLQLLMVYRKRAITDILSQPLLIFGIMLSIIVPNIIGFTVSRGQLPVAQSFVGAVLGVFTSFVLRESYRYLDRERGWFGFLSKIILAPITRVEHFFASYLNGLLDQICYTSMFVVFMLLLTYDKVGPGLLVCFGSMTSGECLNIALALIGIVVAVGGLGAFLGMVPFMVRGDQSFFLLGLIPSLATLCSSLFMNPAELPPILRELALLNPLTYGANAIYGSMHFTPFTSATANWLMSVFVGLTEVQAELLALALLTTAYVALGCFGLKVIAPWLQRCGRMRDRSDG